MKNDPEMMFSQLKAEMDNLCKKQTRIKRLSNDIKMYTRSFDPCAVHSWLESNIELIKQEAPSLLNISDQAAYLCKEKMLQFEAELHEAIISAGLTIYGQWPRYYINNVIQITVDEKKQNCVVGERKLRTLAIGEIISSVSAQLKKITPSPAKLEQFMEELYDSYSSLSSEGTRSISVWDIYKEILIKRQSRKLWRNALASNFRPFGEQEFRACLTELLKKNISTTHGLQMRLLPPIARDESVYIYQPVESRFCHIGRIEFVPIGE